MARYDLDSNICTSSLVYFIHTKVQQSNSTKRNIYRTRAPYCQETLFESFGGSIFADGADEGPAVTGALCLAKRAA